MPDDAMFRNDTLTSSQRLNWSVDMAHGVITIRTRGGISDRDLLERVPMIWQQHPDVYLLDTLVDIRSINGDGGWTWSALRKVAVLWNDYLGSRISVRRVAVLTTDPILARLSNALGCFFLSREFRAFTCKEDALDWLMAR